MPPSTALALVSVLIASIAASAATFQSYLAYSVRHHPLTAQLVGHVAAACGDLTSRVMAVSFQTLRLTPTMSSDGKLDTATLNEWTTKSQEIYSRYVTLLILANVLDAKDSEPIKTAFNQLDQKLAHVIALGISGKSVTEAHLKEMEDVFLSAAASVPDSCHKFLAAVIQK